MQPETEKTQSMLKTWRSPISDERSISFLMVFNLIIAVPPLKLTPILLGGFHKYKISIVFKDPEVKCTPDPNCSIHKHRECAIRVDVVARAALVTKLTGRWIHM